MTRLAALYIHPVKSLHRINMTTLDLDPWGPKGDRRWLIIAPDGRFMTQRQFPAMARILTALKDDILILTTPEGERLEVAPPMDQTLACTVSVWKDHEIMAHDAGDNAAIWLSTFLQTPCRLVHMTDPATARPTAFGSVSFADGFPLLVTNTASLDALNARLAQPVPMERFRPNIVIETDRPWAEDSWQVLQIGTVTLELVKPCSRCLVTTIDQESGTIPVPREPLKTMTGFRHQPGGVMFGQNAVIRRTGTINLGDPVMLVA